MKRILHLVFIQLFILLGIGMFFIPVVEAKTITGTNISIPSNQNIDESVYAFGQTLDIHGVINGDLICGAQTVTINATINGDLICAAQTIHIQGNVLGSLRVAGQSIDAANITVAKNSNFYGQTVTTDASAVLKGDAVAYAQTLTLRGKLIRDLNAGGQMVTLGLTNVRNAVIQDQSLTVEKQARINGSFQYQSDSAAIIQDPNSLLGSIFHTYPPKQKNIEIKPDLFGIFVSILLDILATFLIIFLAKYFFPKFLDSSYQQTANNGGHAFFLGIALVLFLPIIALLLTITLIGAPLALLVFVFWLCTFVLGHAFIAYWLAKILMSKFHLEDKYIYVLLLCSIIGMAILFKIPYIGSISYFLTTVVGTGGIVLSIQKLRENTTTKTDVIKI